MFELSEIKNYLGIAYDDEDTKLQAILDGVESLLIKHLGDISVGDRTIQVENKEVKQETFFIPLINPLSIKTINGTNFSSKVNGTDYFIKDDGNVIVKDLLDYIDNDFGVFKVVVNAGYSEIPAGITSLVAEYVGFLNTLDNGRSITNETMGPRATSFTGLDSQGALKNFKNRLSLYVPSGLQSYIV